MMALKISLKAFLIAITGFTVATACKILPEDVCQANGAGVHCHPCVREAYIVCSDSEMLSVQRCPEENIWNPFLGRCATDSADAPECPRPAPVVPRQLLQSEERQRSWTEWAAAGINKLSKAVLSSFQTVKATNNRPISLADAAPPRQQWALLDAASTTSMPSLRMAMIYSPATPTPVQLQNMRHGLSHAASMQQEAYMLLQDADNAEAAAAKLVETANDSMLHGADADASSISDQASSKAHQMLADAEAAHEAAVDMQAAAQDLLQQAAAEAAGVAMAMTIATSGSSSSSSAQKFYGPVMLSAIFGTMSVNLGDPFVSDDDYYYDEPNTVAESYDDFHSSEYTYGDIESYPYDEDQHSMFGPSPPTTPQAVVTVTSHPNNRGLGLSSELTRPQVTLMGHLEDIHGEDTWGRGELLSWVTSDAFAGSRPLPPPGWQQHSDRLVLSHHYGESSLLDDFHHYHDSDNDAAAILYSTSIIMASAMQDRMVKLAAQAAAASQHRQDGSSSEEDLAAALALSPLPLRMTVKREQEMLQLARFFDGLEDILDENDKAQLKSLDVTDDSVLHVKIVGDLPVLQMGQQLEALLPEVEALKMKSMLNAQMAELFADFVTLNNPDDYSDISMDFADRSSSSQYTQPDMAPLPAGDFTEPQKQQQQQQAESGSQENSNSADDVETVNAVVREFKDAELIQELDSALLQLEEQQQQQQQQQQLGGKASGLALPGNDQASKKQTDVQ